MSADQGRLELKSIVISELKTENVRLTDELRRLKGSMIELLDRATVRIKTLEADLAEQRRRVP